MFRSLLKKSLIFTLVIATVGSAYAIEFDSIATKDASYKQTRNEFDSVSLRPLLAQSRQANIRSRAEVIQEVKQRYNAKVLKVSLNQRRDTYNVRVLMPNGKVRNLQISARR